MSKDFNNLREQGYKGSLSDMRSTILKEYGYADLYEYLKDQGYTGAVADMLIQRARSLGFNTVTEMNTISGLIGRYFTEFLSSVSSYGELTDAITLSGDFVIEVDLTHTEQTGNSMVLGQEGSSASWLGFTGISVPVLRMNIDGVLAATTARAPIADGRFHTVRIERVGSTVEMYVDGILEDTRTNSGTFVWDFLGANNTPTNFYDGYLKNLKIWDDGVLIIDSPMNDAPSSSYFVNRAAVLGSDLGGTAPTTVNSPWVDNGDGSYSIDGSQVGTKTIYYAGLIEAGASYRFVGTVTDSTAGGIRPENADTNYGYTSGNGEFEYVFTTNTNVNFNIECQEAFDGTVSFTLQKIPATTPYIIKRNIADTQVGLYDQVSDGWTGQQTILNNNFESATGWTLNESPPNSEANISSGVLNLISDGTYCAASQSGIITDGDIYRVEAKVLGITGSGASVRVGGVGSLLVLDGVGEFTADLAAVGTFIEIARGGTTDIEIGRVSAKRFLEVVS